MGNGKEMDILDGVMVPNIKVDLGMVRSMGKEPIWRKMVDNILENLKMERWMVKECILGLKEKVMLEIIKMT